VCRYCAIYDACVCKSMCVQVALVYTDMHSCRVFAWLTCVQVVCIFVVFRFGWVSISWRLERTSRDVQTWAVYRYVEEMNDRS
jgi:hypothetical protein